jgi:tetratricopeptide (TPR) repeat protein
MSALTSFEWGLLLTHDGRGREALPWLGRAVALAEGDGWRRAAYASLAQQLNRDDLALNQAEAAVAARPHSPWTRLSRARVHLRRGERDDAVKDYQQALRDQSQTFEERDPAFERQVRRELDLLAR